MSDRAIHHVGWPAADVRTGAAVHASKDEAGQNLAGALGIALAATAVTACAAPPPRLLTGGITADRAAPGGILAVPPGPALAGEEGARRC